MWGATWGADDTIVFGTTNAGLFSVSANGGEPQRLTAPESEVEPHREPYFLPGGRALLFSVGALPANSIAVYSMATGESQELIVESTPVGSRGGLRNPRYSSRHITFDRGRSLWAAPFDLERLAVTGDSFRVLEGIAELEFQGGSFPQFDVAFDDTLVYIPEGALATGFDRGICRTSRATCKAASPQPMSMRSRAIGPSAHSSGSTCSRRTALATSISLWRRWPSGPRSTSTPSSPPSSPA